MVIVKEIVFTYLIYDGTIYHQIERDIINPWVTWVLMWFGKGHTHMVSSAWSDSNEFSSIWGISYIHLF